MEAVEDFEDVLRHKQLIRWKKDDQRLKKLRQVFEGYPSVSYILDVLGGKGGKEGGYSENLLKKRLEYEKSTFH